MTVKISRERSLITSGEQPIMGKQEKVKVDVRFNRKRQRWEAFIDDKIYGFHRYERRALIFGVRNYAKEKGVELSSLALEHQVHSTQQVKKINEIFKTERAAYEASKKALEVAEREADERKNAYKTTLAQYVAALMDYGYSATGAMHMADDASVNTIRKYIMEAGGEQKAASDMWKRAGVRIKGMIGAKKSEIKKASEAGEFENIWSLYDDKE